MNRNRERIFKIQDNLHVKWENYFNATRLSVTNQNVDELPQFNVMKAMKKKACKHVINQLL